MTPPTSRIKFSPAIAATLALLLLTGCSGGDDGVGTRSVEGRIIAVEASAIIEWESLTLLSQDGRDLTFLRGEGIDLRFWRASHLRGHGQDGVPIVVSYEETERGLVAESIEDG